MLLDKFQYLPGNAWVGTDVTTIHFPVAQLFHLCILRWHDANSDPASLGSGSDHRTQSSQLTNPAVPSEPSFSGAQSINAAGGLRCARRAASKTNDALA